MPDYKICLYCESQIRPLDRHRSNIVAQTDKDGVPDPIVTVTCILNRCIIIKPEQIK